MQINKYYIVILLLLHTSISNAQYLLNGGFEQNSFGTCQGTTYRYEFDNAMQNVMSFGDLIDTIHSIDVFHKDSCYGAVVFNSSYIDTISGTWIIAIASGGAGFEAFTMELSANLQKGKSYHLSFFAAGRIGLSTAVLKPIQIGLSTANIQFGDSIQTINFDKEDTWEYHEFTFVAPNNGKHISVSTLDNKLTGSYTFFDNFILTPISGVGVSEKEINRVKITPNPTADYIQFTLEKQSILYIYDLQGRKVLNKEAQKGDNRIDISYLENGIYIIDVNGFKQKIIKN